MKLTFKLYANLGAYLPADARDNVVVIDVPAGSSILGVIDRFGVPRDLVHLVLLNGIYVKPEERGVPDLRDGDTLAVWPPVAGG